MNETLQQALTKLIEKALNGIDSAGDFMAGQIPDVVHQLLIWKACSSALVMILGIFILFAPPLLFKKYWDAICRSDAEPFVMVLVATVPTGFFMFVYNFDWLQIIIAPKLYLLEYAASLVK